MIEDNKAYRRFMEPLTVYISGFYSRNSANSTALLSSHARIGNTVFTAVLNQRDCLTAYVPTIPLLIT
ncbi:hypothetical protein NJ56_16440 [Yersinia ruckeri]|nr:hypothetical protein NJ56_16440 [Yersinia ruckeri]PHZ21309.1 hypothetical protein CS534_02175 [Yersinia ruckeri]